jgi:hypothetical protein
MSCVAGQRHSLVAARVQPPLDVCGRDGHEQVGEHAVHVHAGFLAAWSHTEETRNRDLLNSFAVKRGKHAVLSDRSRMRWRGESGVKWEAPIGARGAPCNGR